LSQGKEAYTASAGRKFGLTVGLAFVVLSVIGRWRGHPISFAVLGSIGVVLVLASLIAPRALGPVDRGWMRIAGIISKVTTPVFMAVVYFVILTPVGLLRRLFAGSALTHRASSTGFWLDRSTSPRGSLERQF
jgi:hypothetical protein